MIHRLGQVDLRTIALQGWAYRIREAGKQAIERDTEIASHGLEHNELTYYRPDALYGAAFVSSKMLRARRPHPTCRLSRWAGLRAQQVCSERAYRHAILTGMLALEAAASTAYG